MATVRVLVVDSDEAVTRSVRAALEGAGCTVQSVPSASQAEAETDRGECDLAFVSLTLPDLGGLELVKRLRARRRSPHVVALTSPGAAEALAAREAGAYSFLEKPADLTPAKIQTVAANALEHRRLVELAAAGRAEAAATLNLEARERQAILQALESTKWNKQAAAALLGLHRPTLYSKLRKHGIPQRRPTQG